MQAYKKKASANDNLKFRPSMDSILTGLIGFAVLLVFRSDFHPSFVVLLIETVVFLALPILAHTLIFERLNKSRFQSRIGIKDTTLVQLGCLAFAALPVMTESISRSQSGGEANEIVFLVIAQNAAWFLSVFSYHKAFARTGFVLFNAIVILVCTRADQWLIYALSIFFFITSMWWLMGSYWSQVKVKAIDVETRSLPIRISFFTGSIILLSLVAAIAWANNSGSSAYSMAGFMPTSGGDRWSDAYARSGIGDGNMLAAGENATSTGAVDSDQFIEDDKPSIYDMMSDVFEAPVMKPKKRRNRAISIEEQSKHIHGVKQSEQSGRTFTTVRKPKTKEKRRKLEDRISDAAFFVEGSVPVRFAVTTFNQFDGWMWSNRELDWKARMNPRINIERQSEKAWYVINYPERYYMRDNRGHKVKIMRLDSKALPSPSVLRSWHIYKIEDKTLFSWGEGDLVNIGGAFIPPQTVFDMVSEVPNFYEIRQAENLSAVNAPSPIWDVIDSTFGFTPSNDANAKSEGLKKGIDASPFTEVPENTIKSRLIDLADDWTDGIPAGWKQVETIVSRVKSEFEVDPANVPPADCEESLGHFLDSGSGPRYLFATLTAQLLRAAGYETRLAGGYLVTSKDFIRSSNQSVVTSENVHVWPEVCVDGWRWIPVEPTPGYPNPFSSQTIWQSVQSAFSGFFSLIGRFPFTSLIAVVAVLALLKFRGDIFAISCFVVWSIVSAFFPGRRLKSTRQLIDARFWAAGLARPASKTISSWFSQIESNQCDEFLRFWNLQNYSERSTLSIESSKINNACWQLVKHLSYNKIKKYSVNLRKRKHNESRGRIIRSVS